MSQPSISQYLTIVTKIFGFPIHYWDFPGGFDGKETACNAGDGWILRLGRSCGEGNGMYSRIFAWGIPRTEIPVP